MARILRGEIRRAAHHPVLILSQDVFNERSGTVIAAVLTSQRQLAGFPLTLKLARDDLPMPSWVRIGQVRTMAVQRVGARLGRATPEELALVTEGFLEIIGA
jgi:mRNA interferase MazF